MRPLLFGSGKWRRGERSRTGRAASMRPLLFGSGKFAVLVTDRDVPRASMRPLLFGSGKHSSPWESIVGGFSFNEAAAFRQRKIGTTQGAGVPPPTLQ